jgi:hypothetical protein
LLYCHVARVSLVRAADGLGVCTSAPCEGLSGGWAGGLGIVHAQKFQAGFTVAALVVDTRGSVHWGLFIWILTYLVTVIAHESKTARYRVTREAPIGLFGARHLYSIDQLIKSA